MTPVLPHWPKQRHTLKHFLILIQCKQDISLDKWKPPIFVRGSSAPTSGSCFSVLSRALVVGLLVHSYAAAGLILSQTQPRKCEWHKEKAADHQETEVLPSLRACSERHACPSHGGSCCCDSSPEGSRWSLQQRNGLHPKSTDSLQRRLRARLPPLSAFALFLKLSPPPPPQWAANINRRLNIVRYHLTAADNHSQAYRCRQI